MPRVVFQRIHPSQESCDIFWIKPTTYTQNGYLKLNVLTCLLLFLFLSMRICLKIYLLYTLTQLINIYFELNKVLTYWRIKSYQSIGGNQEDWTYVLEPATINWIEPTMFFSSELCVPWHHTNSWKSALVEVFIPCGLAKTIASCNRLCGDGGLRG